MYSHTAPSSRPWCYSVSHSVDSQNVVGLKELKHHLIHQCISEQENLAFVKIVSGDCLAKDGQVVVLSLPCSHKFLLRFDIIAKHCALQLLCSHKFSLMFEIIARHRANDVYNNGHHPPQLPCSHKFSSHTRVKLGRAGHHLPEDDLEQQKIYSG